MQLRRDDTGPASEQRRCRSLCDPGTRRRTSPIRPLSIRKRDTENRRSGGRAGPIAGLPDCRILRSMTENTGRPAFFEESGPSRHSVSSSGRSSRPPIRRNFTVRSAGEPVSVRKNLPSRHGKAASENHVRRAVRRPGHPPPGRKGPYVRTATSRRPRN